MRKVAGTANWDISPRSIATVCRDQAARLRDTTYPPPEILALPTGAKIVKEGIRIRSFDFQLREEAIPGISHYLVMGNLFRTNCRLGFLTQAL